MTNYRDQRCGLKEDCHKLSTDFKLISSALEAAQKEIERLKLELWQQNDSYKQGEIHHGVIRRKLRDEVQNLTAALEGAQREIAELKANPTSAFYKERKLLRDEIEIKTVALEVAEDALDNIRKTKISGADVYSGAETMKFTSTEAQLEVQKIKKGLG